MNSLFDRCSAWLAQQLGRPVAVVITGVTIAICVAAAFVSTWRDAVLLWSGAGTGFLSLIYLSVLQNSQNRGAAALQAKLDELLSNTTGARDELISLEEQSIETIEEMRAKLPKRN